MFPILRQLAAAAPPAKTACPENAARGDVQPSEDLNRRRDAQAHQRGLQGRQLSSRYQQANGSFRVLVRSRAVRHCDPGRKRNAPR